MNCVGACFIMLNLIVNPIFVSHVEVSTNRGTPKSSLLKVCSLIKPSILGIPPFQETPIFAILETHQPVTPVTPVTVVVLIWMQHVAGVPDLDMAIKTWIGF